VITVDDDGPSDFNDIQAAIDDANDGDTVIVADGTYTGTGNRDIDFGGKAITVRSKTGATNRSFDCIDNPCDSHRGFIFQSGEDSSSVLRGFTITGGYAGEGGGIYVRDANNPAFIDCELSNNYAVEGGGMYTLGSGIQMDNCLFFNNTSVAGGGIVSYYSDVYVYLVDNCQFVQNQSTGPGGGMVLGGGGSDMKIVNCLFVGNTSLFHGGGIFVNNCGDLRPQIENCTFEGNRAKESGGAVVGFGGSGTNPKIYNSIIWNNEPNSDCGITAVWDGGKCGIPTATAEFSILQSDWQGQSFLTVEDCFVDDPCFASSGFWDVNGTPNDVNDDLWVAGDSHLQSAAGRWDANSESWVKDSNTSVAIDAGDPNSDWSGELWPHGKRINMGAYGGTAEASMSLSSAGNVANLNNDANDIVDYNDLALLVDKWLYLEVLLAEDLDRDGDVDAVDFAILGNNWHR